MTFEQKLGFEVAKEMLDTHNGELQKAKEEFFEVFGEIWEKAKEKGIKMFDLEEALYNYLDTIKEEYYKAGRAIDGVVERETLKNEVAKAKKKKIV